MNRKTALPQNGTIRFPFNERKALSASTYLLSLCNGRMPYMRLIKLLYFADRASLQEFGRPITGDRYVAMKLGPVLSTVYDRIRGGEWGGLIRKSGYDLELIGKEFIDPLSDAEIEILDEVSKTFRTFDHWQLSDLSHVLPEWNDVPKNGTISIETILRALRKKNPEICEVREEANEESFFEEVFSDS